MPIPATPPPVPAAPLRARSWRLSSHAADTAVARASMYDTTTNLRIAARGRTETQRGFRDLISLRSRTFLNGSSEIPKEETIAMHQVLHYLGTTHLSAHGAGYKLHPLPLSQPSFLNAPQLLVLTNRALQHHPRMYGSGPNFMSTHNLDSHAPGFEIYHKHRHISMTQQGKQQQQPPPPPPTPPPPQPCRRTTEHPTLRTR
ncbi:hypothetical protein FB451DRAFT_1172442 [Mycena latifolia]|nr:hypothetical protein FB451DRAFT_1172442 [Mycena latifolia]